MLYSKKDVGFSLSLDVRHSLLELQELENVYGIKFVENVSCEDESILSFLLSTISNKLTEVQMPKEKAYSAATVACKGSGDRALVCRIDLVGKIDINDDLLMFLQDVARIEFQEYLIANFLAGILNHPKDLEEQETDKRRSQSYVYG
jgi:hypothetical protein